MTANNNSRISALCTALYILSSPALGWMPRSRFHSLHPTKTIHSTRGGGCGCGRVSTTGLYHHNDGERTDDDDKQENGENDEYVDFDNTEDMTARLARLEAAYAQDASEDVYSESYTISFAEDSNFPIWMEGGAERRVHVDDWMDFDLTDGAEEPYCVGECCGGDCEQCEIPEDFRVTANGDLPEVDVLAFLGIRRAEPLQVRQDWD